MLPVGSVCAATTKAADDVFGERGRYLIKAGGSLVTTIAYFVMTSVFTLLSTLTFFQLKELETGREEAWANLQYHAGQFKVHLVGSVNPLGAQKLMQQAPAKPSNQPGLVKRITIAIDGAVGTGFLDNGEMAQNLKILAGIGLAVACYYDKVKAPLALSASVIPLMGIRRLGVTGTLGAVGATYGFYRSPELSGVVMGVAKGVWVAGGYLFSALNWMGQTYQGEKPDPSKQGPPQQTGPEVTPIGNIQRLYEKGQALADEVWKQFPQQKSPAQGGSNH